MGFRSDGKTLHPLVQRAVYFNETLVAVQKQRVELEAALAGVEEAVNRGEDLGQNLMDVADAVGREVLLSSLGLGSRDTAAQSALEQSLLADRSQLSNLRQHMGPAHPEVVALLEKIRSEEAYVQGYQDRLQDRLGNFGAATWALGWCAWPARSSARSARKS